MAETDADGDRADAVTPTVDGDRAKAAAPPTEEDEWEPFELTRTLRRTKANQPKAKPADE